MTFFCDTAPNPGLPHIMVQPRESVQDEVREAFFRGLESWGKARREAKTRPLRYLTKMQEQGVSFSIAR
jgi:hypothetical protein